MREAVLGVRQSWTLWRCVPLLVLTGAVLSQTHEPGVDDAIVESAGRVFYVRQTVGNDGHDGLSPQTAWRTITQLGSKMQPGDTAYVGPGLYRETVIVQNGGEKDRRLTFVADPGGRFTGDPPGTVMVTGADPVEESVFEPYSVPGVFIADLGDADPVLSVVEMDGDQYRYTRARDSKKHLVEKLSQLDVVKALPSSHFYDPEVRRLYIHTSDGRPPTDHEIEFINRGAGFYMRSKPFVTVVGFTFRHMGDAGISFFTGSGNGIAVGNTTYGSRQGVRVYAAPNTGVYGNTLFRNDNSGVYFAKGSVNGMAIGNTLYENIKGVRWSSGSDNGQAIDNVSFDNVEGGISIENTNGLVISSNRVVNNKWAQFLVIESEFVSENNCFESRSADQQLAVFDYLRDCGTLADYRAETGQDHSSREGGCGAMPKRIDVRRLHAETTTYSDRARKKLAAQTKGDAGAVP